MATKLNLSSYFDTLLGGEGGAERWAHEPSKTCSNFLHVAPNSQFSGLSPIFLYTCPIPLDLAFWDWRETRVLGRLFQVRQKNTQFLRNGERP